MPRPISTKPAVSAWLVRERKRLGIKPAEVAARLSAMGLPVQEGTVRTWEAGRSPSPENIEGLERLFESRAPTASSGGTPHVTPELAALIERQTAAMERQADAMKAIADRLLVADEEQDRRLQALEAAVALLSQSRDGARQGRGSPLGKAG